MPLRINNLYLIFTLRCLWADSFLLIFCVTGPPAGEKEYTHYLTHEYTVMYGNMKQDMDKVNSKTFFPGLTRYYQLLKLQNMSSFFILSEMPLEKING